MRYTTAWTFETIKFRVTLDIAPEEMDPADSFEFEDDIAAVRNGDVGWFQARVAVWLKTRDGETMIGAGYLGGCAYENIKRDFIESHWRSPADSRNTLAMKAKNCVVCDYFPSMVRTAIGEARSNAAAIRHLRASHSARDMAAWRQQQANRRNPVQLFHATEWTVVIDPPNQMRALMRFTSKDLADVYMRSLKDNNPGAHAHSYILPPAKQSFNPSARSVSNPLGQV